MVLLRNKSTLILSCICYVARICYANVSSDSDDDSLKEALVLVDILKKEYIKALRENVAGIYREENNNTILLEEQSTCAPTTIGDKFNLSRSSETLYEGTKPQQLVELREYGGTEQYALERSSSPPPQASSPGPPLLATLAQPQGLYSSAAQYQMSPSPDYSLYGENVQRPFKAFRRRMPRDYYYYYDQRLNRGYEKPWRNNFLFNSRRKNVDVTTTTATSKMYTTTKPTTTTYNKTNVEFSSEATSKIKSTTPSNVQTKDDTKIKITSKPKPVKSYRKKFDLDPVRDQVAAELANEIENAAAPKSSNIGRGRAKISPMPTRSTKKKSSHSKKYDYLLDFVRTTLRIHMERSTRYPIPFPENHAFCFTNPKSALCRTQI